MTTISGEKLKPQEALGVAQHILRVKPMIITSQIYKETQILIIGLITVIKFKSTFKQNLNF